VESAARDGNCRALDECTGSRGSWDHVRDLTRFGLAQVGGLPLHSCLRRRRLPSHQRGGGRRPVSALPCARAGRRDERAYSSLRKRGHAPHGNFADRFSRFPLTLTLSGKAPQRERGQTRTCNSPGNHAAARGPRRRRAPPWYDLEAS
jgi:hypothetical protein